MFDIGFGELAMVMVVALLVVGPERLPRLARTVGLWLGKGRKFVREVKADIDRELAAEELKKALQKQVEVPELYDIIEETDEALKDASAGGGAQRSIHDQSQVTGDKAADDGNG